MFVNERYQNVLMKQEIIKQLSEMVFPLLIRPVDYGHDIAFFESAEKLEIALRGFTDDNEFEIKIVLNK